MTGRGRPLLIVGAALATAGVVVGFVPVSIAGTACGSAFSPANPFTLTLAGLESCDVARAGWQYVAWILVGAGVVALGAAAFVIFDSTHDD